MKFNNDNIIKVVTSGSVLTVIKETTYIIFYEKVTEHFKQEVGADSVTHNYKVLGIYKYLESNSIDFYKETPISMVDVADDQDIKPTIIDYSENNALLVETIIDYLKTKPTA